MTMREFLDHVDGYHNRQEAADLRAAMVAANVMNALGVKPRIKSPAALLSPKRPVAQRAQRVKEQKFEEMWREMERRRAEGTLRRR